MKRTRAFLHQQRPARYRPVWLILLLLLLIAPANGQEKCIASSRVDQLKKQLASATGDPENKQAGTEWIELGTELLAAARSGGGGEKPDEKYTALLATARTKVCQQLNAGGWPTTADTAAAAVKAFMYLMSKALPIETQVDLYPVVMEAYRLDLIERDEYLASFVDRLRLAVGQRQLFGSQGLVRDGFIVLAPIEHPAQVDQRRTAFKLEPLRSYEKRLEYAYRLPLIRAVTEPEEPQGATPKPRAAPGSGNAADPGLAVAGDEPVIKVSTALVTLDVVVKEAPGPQAGALQKSDFQVYENGKPAEIESFSRADSPFDIVLLLDLSGSTADKVGLIRKSTKRFIELKRPGDRLAIVSFESEPTVISDLEANKNTLLDRLRKIDGGGGSHVWDAVKFALDLLNSKSEKGRRKAVVLMSDGADNALMYRANLGSKISFADLVEAVQRDTTAIFPIYLDTEGPDSGSKLLYANARRTLEYLAEQSAGVMYKAKKLDDLQGLYERVLNDVGTVYTLGFSPAEEITDGRWRSLKVEIPSRPAIKLSHRPGYFPRAAGQ